MRIHHIKGKARRANFSKRSEGQKKQIKTAGLIPDTHSLYQREGKTGRFSPKEDTHAGRLCDDHGCGFPELFF